MAKPTFGGEERGRHVTRSDVANALADALKTFMYNKVRPDIKRREPDRIYKNNESFWNEALSERHFPGEYIALDDFHLMEWLPFAPGRYFTKTAERERTYAQTRVAPNGTEYLPGGKGAMVRGGIGAIRLAERELRGSAVYFLGASSTGVAHEGIPVALPFEEYRKVISVIKEHGGCRVNLVGSLQTLTEELPSLHFDNEVSRYCFFAESVAMRAVSARGDLLITVAAMFSAERMGRSEWETRPDRRWRVGADDDPDLVDKSWTFCSFTPGSSGRDVGEAADWLLDYASRYSRGVPIILTDFDEHRRAFRCHVEFPLADIVHGRVDWETLRVYKRYGGTFIETYIEEVTNVAGDQINASGSNITIINHSSVKNAFNKVKAERDEETAKALTHIEDAINKSGNRDAADNFESFTDELAKPEPKKSLLKTLWKGTLAALPTLIELPDAVAKIVTLFN